MTRDSTSSSAPRIVTTPYLQLTHYRPPPVLEERTIYPEVYGHVIEVREEVAAIIDDVPKNREQN